MTDGVELGRVERSGSVFEEKDQEGTLYFGPDCSSAAQSRRPSVALDESEELVDGPAEEEGPNKWEDPDAPPDRWHCTYLAFLFLGSGLLLPWNALVQSAGLFVSAAMFGACSDIVFVLTCVNTLGTLLVMGIMLYVNGRWKCNGRFFVAGGFLCRCSACRVTDDLRVLVADV